MRYRTMRGSSFVLVGTASSGNQVNVVLGAKKKAVPWMRIMRLVAAVSLVTVVSLASAVRAAEEESATELAKKTQNPVADLISVPFENSFLFRAGPSKRTITNLLVEPVIPIHLTHDWNLITRTIVPMFNVPSLAPGIDPAAGLGDINPTFFLSPANSKKFMWGVGPTFTFPTASNRELGSGKWSAGPAAVALTMQGPWVIGVLGNNQWSMGGWGPKKVDQLLLEPFVHYNFEHGWFLSAFPILTANWEASNSNTWTVPVGAGGGRLFRLRELPGGDSLGDLGKLPMEVQLLGYYNAIRPDQAPTAQLVLQFTFLFPK